MYFDKETECLDYDDMQDLQGKKLIETVNRCYNNVPFYKSLFDSKGLLPSDITSIKDICKMPFTNREDVISNSPYGLFAVPLKDVVRIHASSGTHGKPKIVGYTTNDLETWSNSVIRGMKAVGVSSDNIVQISFGYGLFTGGLGFHFGVEKMGATVVPTSTGNTKTQLDVMTDLGSTVLVCTPSYAMHIGEEIINRGINPDKIKIRKIITGAEPSTEEMRKQLQSLFSAKVYDTYGLAEVTGPGVAFECEETSGLHINEDYYFPEIIDPKTGEVLPYGQEGELVFTTLQKQAVPLLRYRTGDISCLYKEKCGCGRTLVKMKKPVGRTDDMLIIKGVNVFPSQIETVLFENANVSNYQIVVTRTNYMDILKVYLEVFNNDHNIEQNAKKEQQLKVKLKEALGIKAEVRIVDNGVLDVVKGKAKRVIDNRKM